LGGHQFKYFPVTTLLKFDDQMGTELPVCPTWQYVVLSLLGHHNKSGKFIKRLKFLKHTMHKVDTHDLLVGYLFVHSTALPWPPFLMMKNCMNDSCDDSGYFKDYIDIVSKQRNFTFVSHKDVHNDWCVIAKSGPFNMSGNWGGVMGGVIKKTHDMSLNALALELRTMLSFVPVFKGEYVPEVDFGILTRPLT
jgi:hypothetical protein